MSLLDMQNSSNQEFHTWRVWCLTDTNMQTTLSVSKQNVIKALSIRSSLQLSDIPSHTMTIWLLLWFDYLIIIWFQLLQIMWPELDKIKAQAKGLIVFLSNASWFLWEHLPLGKWLKHHFPTKSFPSFTQMEL